MPALETKETQMPRSALRHRPLSEAAAPGPAPLYRRASRVQGPGETQPRQTGAPVTPPRRRRLHPLLYLGLGLLAMLVLMLVLSVVVSWWSTTMDDLHYGRPRTFQVDAVVGHGDSVDNPSHFIALNYRGRPEVIEFPGGDASKARIYLGPQLYGTASDLVPITLSFVDVSGNHQPDMLVHLHYKGWFGFLLKRSGLYVQGLIRFGPVRTWRGGNAVRMALDAFESRYGRLPDDDEKRRLVQKLAWFDRQYRRVPTPEEIVRIVQQLELR